jgi:hypothetical protein
MLIPSRMPHRATLRADLESYDCVISLGVGINSAFLVPRKVGVTRLRSGILQRRFDRP